ncbi:hypothetical protein MCOR23_010912 [Pyricularia oryzae]|nr:hypothetical protein MCOR23_010912 [Pyricularia oryzae]KAI6420766.1 hypothetical protein MCOR24_004585 [Pyricularia oryzae]
MQLFNCNPSPRRGLGVLLAMLCMLVSLAAAATKIKDGADPTILRVGDMYYSAEASGGNGVNVRRASTILGLGSATSDNGNMKRVWTAGSSDMGDVWAPEITIDSGRTYIYFAAKRGDAKRTFIISADEPYGDYSDAQKLDLPDDRWAIDGALFTFEGQRWFVWSGWSGTSNVEQNLYICKMNSPTEPTGPRYIISQPREKWERDVGNPYINEGPQPIVDPNGQLHIVYSANGSWDNKYCLGDLRLRKGGDPTYVWDWYKSNGCLFGSAQANMMSGWDATLEIDGPGHHTFVLPKGDVQQSPGGTNRIPFVFHGVRKGTYYSWTNRDWFTGSFVWWGSTTYRRANVPGANEDTGFGFKFFE